MRLFLTLFATCCVFVKISAQSKDFTDRLKDHKISLDDPNKKIGNLPFKSISLLDARWDTTSFGIFETAQSNRLFQLKFEKNASAEIIDFVTAAYNMDTASTGNLLVVLKKLWVSSVIEDESTKGDDADPAWADGVLVQADLFREYKGTYRALQRIDTVLVGDHPLEMYSREYVQQGIQSLLGDIVNRHEDSLHLGKSTFQLHDIEQYISQYRQCAVFRADKPTKGIYMNFTEFKNNIPSISVFDVTNSKKGDNLYVKNETGAWEVLRSYWGYSDGDNIYICSSGNNFMLYKVGNSLYIYGYKSFDRRKNLKVMNILLLGPVTGIMGKQSKRVVYKGVAQPLQLDMISGTLY